MQIKFQKTLIIKILNLKQLQLKTRTPDAFNKNSHDSVILYKT